MVIGAVALVGSDAQPPAPDPALVEALSRELVDAGENRVVWRAMATATVSGNPKKARARIPSIIRKMFDGFPPEPPPSR